MERNWFVCLYLKECFSSSVDLNDQNQEVQDAKLFGVNIWRYKLLLKILKILQISKMVNKKFGIRYHKQESKISISI